ncbi:MAG: Nif3-like dinuclear metal center hexameric protein [Lachnospiraceae bacterium]|jgi:dinuclear metal center YbgI/SA1388 family protein|nr:Nif3-like dinuclear metal center hexameric protein [Lachnospiraceae bacterium]MCI6331255.1 Nif3-like dinuclear metal center hexameric protein [Lachnospiraceae bacterium]MCI6666091.1 Nif3-like dinuclear metal center hexameric protein [Lachnospiraceae bacterium]MCI6977725.1 Nif3-like dinuclear metal center hexameric protein [Lachnospiraceae bacterium]MDD7224060.1 Nif3-like dinuclear metal center hexameric protein [Lachnospiraceae bacterium]
MECALICESLEELSPKRFALSFDNVGLLVGRYDKDVKTIYIALDATDEVIDAAIECEADMLITHHPMIFSAIKSVRADDFIGRRILKLAKYDISYYAMHTNFDVMGMADAAADEIDLIERDVLQVTYEDEIGAEGIGRIGRLREEMSLIELCDFVKERFMLDTVKVFGDPDRLCNICAISPGSGKSMIKYAIEKGADVIITGDIDHHEGIDSVAQGLCVIDAGHFGIEKIFVPYMEEFIRREMPEIKVYTHEMTSPFMVL